MSHNGRRRCVVSTATVREFYDDYLTSDKALDEYLKGAGFG